MTSQITLADYDPKNRARHADVLTSCIYKYGWVRGFAEAVAWLGGMERWEIAVDHWARSSAAKRQMAAKGLRAAHLTGAAAKEAEEWLKYNG